MTGSKKLAVPHGTKAVPLLLLALFCAAWLSHPGLVKIGVSLNLAQGGVTLAAIVLGTTSLIATICAIVSAHRSRSDGLIGLSYGMLLALFGFGMLHVKPTFEIWHHIALRRQAAYKLRMIGAAIFAYSNGYSGQMPPTLDAMVGKGMWLEGDEVLIDPVSRKKFLYIGNGKKLPQDGSVLAYSPEEMGSRTVLTDYGSVGFVSSQEFVIMRRKWE